jgi:hypothetical protein
VSLCELSVDPGNYSVRAYALTGGAADVSTVLFRLPSQEQHPAILRMSGSHGALTTDRPVVATAALVCEWTGTLCKIRPQVEEYSKH